MTTSTINDAAIRTHSHSRWRSWLVSQALPLWSESGFDVSRGLYRERLDWEGRPIRMDALRLMVQARQVATYCRAKLDGLYDGTENALRCLAAVERLYYGRDGHPGWVFSIAPNDAVASGMRDLYAHAFILFAYGWAIRLSDEKRYRQIARRTAEEINLIFATGNNGYLDSVPAQDALRRQNPHMHLLEAYLVLFDATGDDFYLVQSRALVRLAVDHLIDRRSGLLLEFFNAQWAPSEPPGCNHVEPGHLFEWAWLLHEYERLALPENAEAIAIREITDRFMNVGTARGCDPDTGLVFNAMTENGVVLDRSTRIWPQTEMLRLISRRDSLLKKTTFSAEQIGMTFLERYAPERLNGGWIDRLDPDDKICVDHMPASSLYHIYGAGRELVGEQEDSERR